jgi:predicted ester cyclase
VKDGAMTMPGDLIATLYDAYNGHDAAAAGRLYAPWGRHVEVATGTSRTGAAATAEGLAGLLEALPDVRWEERMRIVDGSRAAVTYVLAGTLKARFGPFDPAGQALELRRVHVIESGPHGIELCEDYWDASTFGRQMRSS